MKPTNPKLINQLRTHAKPVPMAKLQPLYIDADGLQHDIAVLQRFDLVAVNGGNVSWRGS